MREIKFRAWDWMKNEMLYQVPIQSVMVGAYLEFSGSALKIMQYTGLKDKNGKEIYEGDIIKCERSYWTEDKICQILWDDNSAGFYLFYPPDSVDSESLSRGSMFLVDEHQREIIGNIYSNPELLTKEI